MGGARGADRAVRLSERGVQELALWGAQSAHVGPRDLIFSFDGRLPVRTESARKHFFAVLKRAGIDRRGRTPYCLRHTFATRALESGALSPAEVQFLMGHSPNGKTVWDSYFHPSAKMLRRMATDARGKLDDVPGLG